MNYFHKQLKTNTVFSKESNTESASKFYNLMKDYLIEKNANYITPK